jgi:hypothetical protein
MEGIGMGFVVGAVAMALAGAVVYALCCRSTTDNLPSYKPGNF